MPADLLVAFTAFAIVMSGTPGPNVMLVMASGVNHGFRATLPHMLGVTVGFSLMLLAVGFGLGRVFEAMPKLYTVLKVASVIYLCWLAWKIMNTKPVAAGDTSSVGKPMTFLQGGAFQWVNPKAWAICLSVVAAYTVPGNFLISMLIMAALFVVINFICLVVWCGFGVGLRSILQDPRYVRVFNVVMALLLLASMVPVLMR
jgi:threonine/homoserine/homoserine lactone efflux protein